VLERRKLRTLLQARFELDDDELRPLVEEAVVREHDSVDLYGFTSVLCRELDQDGRKHRGDAVDLGLESAGALSFTPAA
jgi:uncharacterized tellurite resistance protein B-like protein